jgi:tRNA1Val (adenine37-N6)-methyltransferase
MKVGTDGVLLGAWSEHKDPHTILDIGTGSGLIALIMAQKYSTAQIDALEIEKTAYEAGLKNIRNSPWSNRINIINTALQEFCTTKKYDLIVSNPPFFQEKVLAKTTKRQWARQHIKMTPDDIFLFSQKYLSPHGILNLIYPYNKKDELIETAQKHQLFPNKLLIVKGNRKTNPKRILISFSQKQKAFQINKLTIEESRHVYTEEYKKIVRDFYLKM